MKKEEQKSAEKPTATFSYAAKNVDSVVQAHVTRECQHPVTPRKLTDEDWRYGIGLN